ncbi:MAG: hypothetical protein GQ570_15525 [Helicobacteraceae bacterium]|nr:hypothetical protein [Helicobacteraceae bacterium]
MANCPVCKSKLKLVTKKETGALAYLRCENQKTEKQGTNFVEVGKCKFKINFKSKLYDLKRDDMKNLLAGEKIKIKDGNILSLDLEKEMFTDIEFVDKYSEEDF